jgi:hypothetical protein
MADSRLRELERSEQGPDRAQRERCRVGDHKIPSDGVIVMSTPGTLLGDKEWSGECSCGEVITGRFRFWWEFTGRPE